MANKTFIPAFVAKVGDWKYYICVMKYAELARQVSFAYELGGNQDLGTLIQRGISERTSEITKYLLNSEHRFLGSIIVAAWGGEPVYTPLTMDDPEGILTGIDRNFGVLTFDGTQQYFALDGQHRLRAIKDAVKKKPELGSEDISVLLVAHFDTAEGKERTRRLFTNINRNAKTTTGAENIALDVDDGVAILTRRLLFDDPFLGEQGVVLVFTRKGSEGNIKLAGKSVSKTAKLAFTTMQTLYDCSRHLLVGSVHRDTIVDRRKRPTDEQLDEAYEHVSRRLADLLLACGKLRTKLDKAASYRDVRAPKNSEASGHPFMRPVIQVVVCKTAEMLIEQELLDWDKFIQRLSQFDWEIGMAPWNAVFNSQNNRMITSKENKELLGQLLRAHLAPRSKEEIKRSRKAYREIRGVEYPIPASTMEKNLDPS